MKKIIATLLILGALTTNANAQMVVDTEGQDTVPVKIEVQHVNSNIDYILDLAEYHCNKNTKYVFGAISTGDNPTEFDCSSFIQWLYGNIGIELPRVSYEQAKVGQAVNIKDIKPGDIICFVTSDRNNGDITHVGLYIGNELFAHARNSKMGTRVDKYEGYWVNTTRTIRRVAE